MGQLEVSRDGSVMVVTMNRPKRKNAMTLTMFALMADAWSELSSDDELRCAILTGAEGNFSSGMDLRAMAGDVDPDGAIDEQARLRDDPGFVYRGLLKTYRPTKPVIAAVEGVAIAGGTEILQGTDIRVAGESARFGVSEARWSLYPMGGSAVRLQRQIPYTVAADILLTGKHIGAPEAKEIGLIGHVVPDGSALDKSREIAATIAENGPLAVEAILKTLHETQHMSETDAFAYESDYAMKVMASDDSKEGPRAFAEKRTPQFKRS
jgi:enoyl-CoA hydratase